ncbi:MAG: hypothetical protein V2J08_09840 [Desulfotignum sp.]|jgi:hypothetical protein|nr:hypothetical protein [Desulfotignum sp.]
MKDKWKNEIAILLMIGLLLGWVSGLQAAVPRQMSYQGQLSDDTGNPLNGFYLINFYLFSTETGGSHLWNEQQLVQVSNGIFNVSLGSDDPFPEDVFDNADLYLEIEIFNSGTGWESLTPRQQITSTAFAIKAGIAESIADGGVSNVMIADNAVSETKIAPGAVSADKIANGAIVSEILAYDGAGSNIDADLLDGLDSSAFAASDHDHEILNVWTENGNYIYPSGEEATYDPDVWVCIGNKKPETLLHIYDFDTNISGDEDHRPQIYIDQDGNGDAALTYILDLSGGNRHHFTLGIDQHFPLPPATYPASFDFKICHETYHEVGNAVPDTLGYLKGEAYNSPEMMVRVHGTDWSESGPEKKSSGIIDFNHQSRARVHLSDSQVIDPGFWIGVEFNAITYDEHGEMTLGSAGQPSVFTARETGYYQVNARVEFLIDEDISDCYGWGSNSYASIAIFHNQTTHYAFGTNHQIYNDTLASVGGASAGWFVGNNAPNISDVVFLQAGETVEIQVFQNSCVPLMLKGGPGHLTYYSIHKLS